MLEPKSQTLVWRTLRWQDLDAPHMNGAAIGSRIQGPWRREGALHNGVAVRSCPELLAGSTGQVNPERIGRQTVEVVLTVQVESIPFELQVTVAGGPHELLIEGLGRREQSN